MRGWGDRLTGSILTGAQSNSTAVSQEYSFLVTSVIECLPLRFILFCKQYSQFGIFSEMYKTSSVAYASSK